MQISMPVGGPSCCMILTCLEVLRACHRHCDPEDVNYSLQVALLYQHARHKVSVKDNLYALYTLNKREFKMAGY